MKTWVYVAVVASVLCCGAQAWALDASERALVDAVDGLDADRELSNHELRVLEKLAVSRAAVVKIAGSTGVNIEERGLVLTVLHNLDDEPDWSSIPVEFPGGLRTTGRVTKTSKAHGLALVELDGSSFPSARIARHAPDQGDSLFVIGNPNARSGAPAFYTSRGELRREDGGEGLIAYDAWTYWGHGGAPVFDTAGRIVGLHTAWEPDTKLRLGRSLSSVRAFLAESSEPELAPAELTILKSHARQLRAAVNEIERGDTWTAREARVERAIRRAHTASVKVGLGSGVVISPTGHLLTAFHVVDSNPEGTFRVTFGDGERFDARVIAYSKRDDLALLKLPEPDAQEYPHVSLASDAPEVHDVVVVIGNPGKKSGRPGFYTSVGQVLWYGPRRGILGDMAYDAWTYWGHSGGPVFNESGQVVGIHNSWDSENAWRHGLKLSTVASFLESAM